MATPTVKPERCPECGDMDLIPAMKKSVHGDYDYRCCDSCTHEVHGDDIDYSLESYNEYVKRIAPECPACGRGGTKGEACPTCPGFCIEDAKFVVNMRRGIRIVEWLRGDTSDGPMNYHVDWNEIISDLRCEGSEDAAQWVEDLHDDPRMWGPDLDGMEKLRLEMAPASGWLARAGRAACAAGATDKLAHQTYKAAWLAEKLSQLGNA